MPRSALVLPALASLTVAAVLASGAPADAAAAPHGRSAVTFTSTKSHHVVAPASTRPGVAHLRLKNKNRRDVLDEIVVVEAKHAASSSQAQVASELGRRSPKKLLEDYRVTAFLKPASGMYVHLKRGIYYLADVEHDKFTASDITMMRVSGTREDAQVPTSRGTSVSSHRTLSMPHTLPKSGWLHLRNDSSSLADLVLLPVSDKATNAQLRDLVAHPTEKKVETVLGDHGFSFDLVPLSIFGPHTANWVQYHGSARRYIAVLEAFTGSSGPHLKTGQVRVVTLK